MLITETIALYYENHIKHTNIFSRIRCLSTLKSVPLVPTGLQRVSVLMWYEADTNVLCYCLMIIADCTKLLGGL
jgi:hypothetical protein